MELEYHGKLKFSKLEFTISGRSLYISKTVIFNHFGQQITILFLFFAYYTETSVNEGCIHYKLVMSSHESS